MKEPPKVTTRLQLRTVNHVLTVLIILICGYVFLLPFLPKINWWIGELIGKHKSDYSLHTPTATSSKPKPKPTDNRLIIPEIGVDTAIFTDGETSLNKGVWLRPKSNLPDQGGNTVIAGHRFTYNNPNGVFYNLDKLKKDDVIAVFWNQTEYNYKVRETKVVPATQISVESPTNNDQLTLYTCTPVWSATDRLVIIADQVYKEDK